ncbi:MAG: hypothetical protein E6248_15565 [Clostridium sp.]|uniref:hypothetical protein n=1 Tax=Clostridium sp. TaxID=1506 RepID=UPI00290D22B9|nr:hypothetical protein [Clostridium sp.]MDU5111854.1 hypothetical protein [Clostridium sp.]
MFLLEYIKSPKKVGVVSASSKYLADEMIRTINILNESAENIDEILKECSIKY